MATKTCKARKARKARKTRKTRRAPRTMEKALQFKPRIHIDEINIADGLRNNGNHCIVANGARASIPGAKNVKVSSEYMAFSLGPYRLTYATPITPGKKIAAFDNGAKIKPFSFRLALPVGVRPTRVNPYRGKTYQRPGTHKGVAAKRRCTRKSAQRDNGIITATWAA